MDIDTARAIVHPLGVDMIFNRNLSLWSLIIDDFVSYISEKQLAAIEVDEFKVWVSHKIMEYAAHANKQPALLH